MSCQWFRARARYNSSPHPARRPRRGPGQSVRPHLEDLESRQVPSTVTVTTPADSGPGSLRQALLDAQEGDTIDFDAALAGQTITLTSGELAITKGVDIEGPGASQLTISGNHHGRVFDISQGGLTVTIAGLTITNGLLMGPAVQGGGIFVAGGTVTLADCTLSNNEANAVPPDAQTVPMAQGGGIYMAGGNVSLADCTLSNNTAIVSVNFSFLTGGEGSGGGIYVAGGSLVVNASTLDHNRATGGPGRGGPAAGPGGPGLGGGIYLADGSLQINRSTLASNQVTGGTGGGSSGAVGGAGGLASGAGAYMAGGRLEVDDSTVAASQATGGNGGAGRVNGGSGGPAAGSGLFVAGGSAAVDDSTFALNNASGGLGGTGAHGSLAGQASGGGIGNSGTLTLTGVTVSGNAVGGNGVRSGGGMASQAGATTTIRNTIVAADSSPSAPDVSGPLASLGHNLIGDGTGGSGFADTDLVGTTAAPIDPQLQPLGDNGGPTRTMRPLPSSPAIDAGDNTDAPPTDQRGFCRIVHHTIDIGAVELQRGERHGRHDVPSYRSESSPKAAEVSRIIPALGAGRPQVLLEDSTLRPSLPAARLGPDRDPGPAHRLDTFFQLLEGNEHRDGSAWPTFVGRAGERGSLLRLIPGIDRGEELAALLT